MNPRRKRTEVADAESSAINVVAKPLLIAGLVGAVCVSSLWFSRQRKEPTETAPAHVSDGKLALNHGQETVEDDDPKSRHEESGLNSGNIKQECDHLDPEISLSEHDARFHELRAFSALFFRDYDEAIYHSLEAQRIKTESVDSGVPGGCSKHDLGDYNHAR